MNALLFAGCVAAAGPLLYGAAMLSKRKAVG
jgi:hypothetical protein